MFKSKCKNIQQNVLYFTCLFTLLGPTVYLLTFFGRYYYFNLFVAREVKNNVPEEKEDGEIADGDSRDSEVVEETQVMGKILN